MTNLTSKAKCKHIGIVGGGLGGLSAAIHLRIAGNEVDLYEANETLGGRANQIKEDGFSFDTGPSLLNYPWVFEELFQSAGRKMEDYVTLLKVDPSVGFQWEDGTKLHLSSQLDKLLAACEHVEPGCGPNLVRFLGDASFKYRLAFDKLVSRNADSPLSWMGALRFSEMAKLSLWRSLDSELGRFFSSRYIREALGSYGMYLGGSPYDLPGFFSILAYGELAYGLWLPKGGIFGLVEGIARLATELGVRIHTGRPVSKITVDNNRVSGLQFQDGSHLPYEVIVSNVDLPTTDTVLLNDAAGSAKLKAKAESIRMTPGVLTFYWGIRGKVDGIGHHTIFLPDDYRGTFDRLFKGNAIDSKPAFYVSVASETDSSLAPAGHSTVFVLVPTPVLSAMGSTDWTAEVARVKSHILARLKQHGFALSPDDIVHETVYTPEEWRSRFGLYDGSAFGAAHTLFQVGPFRSRNYSDTISGLYYTGASTTPGTGLPMVLLSGKLTADRIATRAR